MEKYASFLDKMNITQHWHVLKNENLTNFKYYTLYFNAVPISKEVTFGNKPVDNKTQEMNNKTLKNSVNVISNHIRSGYAYGMRYSGSNLPSKQ